TLEPGETLAELLARLEALEKRLGGGETLPQTNTAMSAKAMGPSGGTLASAPAPARSIHSASAIPGSQPRRSPPGGPTAFAPTGPSPGAAAFTPQTPK